jgi:WD40 repeat protein
LRAIIESPLAAVGMPVYEPGLAEVLVGDVREEGNPLPLLEFTLTLLWERQRRGVLTHQTYWELGGLAGALASYAEQVCGRYLASDSGTADLRWVLGQMVSPVGPDRVVRRVVELDQLGTRAELARELAASRLVTLGTTVDGRATVEIAHEALARHWPRFRTWVEQDRDFRAWQDELDRQAERWHGGPDKARLLRGKVLRDAQAQVRRYPGMLTGRQLAFLSASTRHQHARSFRVYLACVLVIVLAAALAEGTWFYVRQQGSVNAGNAAQSLLVQDQQQAGSSRPMESVALQVRAFRTDDDVSTRDLLHALAGELQFATAIIPGSFRYAGAQQPINANASGLVVMDPDGKLVAWNLAGRHPTSVVIPADPGPSGAALSVAWLGTDKLVTSYSHGPSVIWDAATGRVVGRLPFGGDVLVTDAAGQRIAYGNSGDRSLREVSLAHLRAAPQVIRLPGQVNPSPQSIPGQVSVTDVLPDGDLVVQTGANRLELADPGGTRNLPAPSGASVVQVIDGGANRQAAVACVTSGSNTILEARSLLTGALLGQYSQYTARGVTDCESEVGVLSADGRYLAVTTGLTSSVTSNSPVTNVGEIGGLIQPVPTPPGYDAVRTVAEPGGAQRVILEGMDSMLVLEVPPLNPMLHARQVAVSAQLSSKYLLLALPNGHVDAWDTTTLRETGSVTAAPPADADELQIAADPAGNVVATLDGRASTIRLWRLPVLAPIGAIHLATPAGYFNAGVQLSVSGTRLTVSQWQTRKTPGNNLDQPGRVEFSTWDVRTQRRTAGPAMVSSNDALANESDSGSFLVLNPGGTELVQDQDGSIRRILLSTGMVVPGSEITDNDSPRSLSAQPAIDASGRFLALAHGNVVEIWDMNSGQQVARLVIAQGFSVQAVSFGANPHILDIGITGPQSETADMVQAWDWEPLLGIPAWFGIKYSTISMVDDPPVSILDEANTAGFTPVTRSVDPRTWLAEICNAWYPNPLDTAVAGLPANSWTGSVCPGR